MTDPVPFGLIVLLVGAVGLAALLSNRLTVVARVPAPAVVFVATAVAVTVIPELHSPSEKTVERLVTVALLCILFDGGMDIGWARFRGSAAPVALVGLVGTFATVAGLALALRFVVGLAWYPALLVGTALAPTDPAVVFSVLGRREVEGRSGTILEAESGVNDPVGIALMVSLVSAGGVSGRAFGHVAGDFALQLGVGAAVGAAGGLALRWFMTSVALPSGALYPLRTLASALVLYGIASVAHGSGFLAVFIAGIVIGDTRVPHERAIVDFHAALTSVGEIVAFVVLGLTVDIGKLARADVWLPGVAIGVALVVIIRPLLVGPLLIGSGLNRHERVFVLLAGLKGAVPILLGTMLMAAHVTGSARLYGIVVVAVVVSVTVQASLVPTMTRVLQIRMRERP